MLERWSVPKGHQSIARLYLKRYTEDLSDLLWCGHASVDTVIYNSESIANSEPAKDVITLSDKAQRQRILAYDMKQFRNSSEQFKTWTNHSAIVSLSSVFEMYIKRVASLAIQSDPGLFASSSRAIDGLTLLKRKNKYDYDKEVSKITSGEWNSRKSAYSNLFDYVPEKLVSIISELDCLRNARNKVGHIYARDTAIDDDFSEFYPLQPLSYTTLINSMGLVKKASDIIDEHLFQTHIGMYELIWYFHTWSKKQQIATSKDFKAKLDAIGYRVSAELCSEIECYYKSL